MSNADKPVYRLSDRLSESAITVEPDRLAAARAAIALDSARLYEERALLRRHRRARRLPLARGIVEAPLTGDH
ncbi:hypothetical protein GCM10027535_52770 [Mycolicibacterium hippocampi]|uniref:Uncharacterized protein n=1 Tax=Mycolicibacterium hippocampi TaxID=659824 RepID=A0A7I9ZV62_9MYCO|nr:hypothetical protein MHIP_53170 [Mycolicibacterium hippocampi]